MTKPTKFDKVVKREICQISSKGTRVYTPLDVEASTPNSNYFLSLVEKCQPGANPSHYGVCFLDTTIGDFYLGQFEDDRCNSRILTLLAHYPPVHVNNYLLFYRRIKAKATYPNRLLYFRLYTNVVTCLKKRCKF